MLAVIESCRKEKLKLMRDMKANGFDTKVKRFNEKVIVCASCFLLYIFSRKRVLKPFYTGTNDCKSYAS